LHATTIAAPSWLPYLRHNHYWIEVCAPNIANVAKAEGSPCKVGLADLALSAECLSKQAAPSQRVV